MPENTPETKDHKKIKKIPSLAEDLACCMGMALGYYSCLWMYPFSDSNREVDESTWMAIIFFILLEGALSRWYSQIPPRRGVIERISGRIFIKKMLGFSLVFPLVDFFGSLLRCLESTYNLPNLEKYFFGTVVAAALIYHCFFRRKSQDSSGSQS